jgi:hypothetical protein
MTHTEVDFERLSWHDCYVHGIELRAGDPDENDWTSDLALDIDFIAGCQAPGQYSVAPADLVFHGVTDPRIRIDWGDSGHQAALHLVSIHVIERERVRDQKVHLDRPYYRWRILLNWPDGGEISFGAVGFTQTLRAAPVLSQKEHLPRSRRSPAAPPEEPPQKPRRERDRQRAEEHDRGDGAQRVRDPTHRLRGPLEALLPAQRARGVRVHEQGGDPGGDPARGGAREHAEQSERAAGAGHRVRSTSGGGSARACRSPPAP